jgi:hypothetical protein
MLHVGMRSSTAMNPAMGGKERRSYLLARASLPSIVVEELAECAPTLRLLSGVVTFSP